MSVFQWSKNKMKLKWCDSYSLSQKPCHDCHPLMKRTFLFECCSIYKICHLKVKLLTFERLPWRAKFQLCVQVPEVYKLRKLFDFVQILACVWTCLTYTWHSGCIGPWQERDVSQWVSAFALHLFISFLFSTIVWQWMHFLWINQNRCFLEH